MDVTMENTSYCMSTKYALEKFSGDTSSTHVFRIVVYGVMFFFGVTGNVLIVCVYRTKTLKTSTHVFIMALAAADLAVCLMHIFNVLVVLVTNNYKTRVPYVLEFIMTLKEAIIVTSVFITALIAADRYDCICRHRKRFFTTKRAKATLVVSLVVSIIISIPSFVAVPYYIQLLSQTVGFAIALLVITVCYTKVYTAISRHVRVGQAPSMQVEFINRTSIHTGRPPNNGLDKELNSAIVPCSSKTKDIHMFTSHVRIPSISETSSQPMKQSGGDLNVGFLRTTSPIREHQADITTPPDVAIIRKFPTNEQNPNLQRKTTRMLFITSVLFLLTWLPYWILILLTSLLSLGVCLNIDPNYFTLLRSMHVLLYINNALNPLVYGLANRRFRKDCKEVLRKMSLC